MCVSAGPKNIFSGSPTIGSDADELEEECNSPSFSKSKFSPFFHGVNAMAAISRAGVRRTVIPKSFLNLCLMMNRQRNCSASVRKLYSDSLVGEIPGHRVGRFWRYRASELDS